MEHLDTAAGISAQNRILYGGGYGYANGRGAFASPSSNAVRIDRNNEVQRLALDRISDQNEETRRNLGEARVMDNITEGHNRICDKVTASEFRSQDRLRDIEREMNANARAAAECCCEIKLEACKNTAEIKALIIAENSATREQIRGDALAAANAELTALKTQIACQGNRGG